MTDATATIIELVDEDFAARLMLAAAARRSHKHAPAAPLAGDLDHRIPSRFEAAGELVAAARDAFLAAARTYVYSEQLELARDAEEQLLDAAREYLGAHAYLDLVRTEEATGRARFARLPEELTR